VAVNADNVPTLVVADPACYADLEETNSEYQADVTFCAAVIPLEPASAEACSSTMICTEFDALTGPGDAAKETYCRESTTEAGCIAESRADCSWEKRCAYDDGRAQCWAEEVEGEAGLIKYVAALFPTMLLAITIAIVFPLLVFFGWYVWRCFNCCGGRKANKGLLCSCRQTGMCPQSTDPALADFVYGKKQIWCFKGLFLLFFLFTLVGSLVGMAGNSLLNDGLQGTVDTFVYELSVTVETVESVFAQIVALDDGSSGMDPSMQESISEIKCAVASMQSAINDSAPQVFELRALAVLVVCLIPMAVTALGLVAAWCNSKCLSCCIALMMSWLMILVWISFGLHGYLGMIFGDLCLEMDLSLHYPAGSSVVIPFLPSDMNPCSGDSGYDAMFDEVAAGAEEALPAGADAIKDFCNKAGSFTDLSYFVIDCTGVTGAGKMLSGAYPNYIRNPGTSLTLDVFKSTKDNIFVEDPGINAEMVVAGALVPGASCTSDAEAYDASTEAGRCPDKDPNSDCLPSCCANCPADNIGDNTVANNDVTDLPGISGAIALGVTISTCPATARKSLEQCGSLGADGCKFPKLQGLACKITGGMDQLADLAAFVALLENDIKPILRCEFVKDMFKSMYMPLCVDSMNGFALVTAANGLGGVIMLLMIPFSVIATKRLDKQNQAMKTAVNQDVSYTGAQGEAASPNKVMLPPLTQPSTPMM
jgi:hypothetical protein